MKCTPATPGQCGGDLWFLPPWVPGIGSWRSAVMLGKGGSAICGSSERRRPRAWEPQGTEVAFTFWQMGPRVMCCGNSGSEVCQHCRKKSSGCEQNSSAALQAGKEDEMGLQTLHRYPVYKSHTTSAWPSGQPSPLGFHQGLILTLCLKSLMRTPAIRQETQRGCVCSPVWGGGGPLPVWPCVWAGER